MDGHKDTLILVNKLKEVSRMFEFFIEYYNSEVLLTETPVATSPFMFTRGPW